MKTDIIKIGSQPIKKLYRGLELIWGNLTPTIPPQDELLRLRLDGDIVNSSSVPIGMEEYGSFSDGEGRKPSTMSRHFLGGGIFTEAARFNDFPINSDKISVSMWVKALSSDNGGVRVLLELGLDVSKDNAFAIAFNYAGEGTITVVNRNSVTHQVTYSNHGILSGEWVHVFLEINRANNKDNETKLWVNNTLLTGVVSQVPEGTEGNTGNFSNKGVNIGTRDGWLYAYRGFIQDFRLYNRVLTTEERISCFSE